MNFLKKGPDIDLSSIRVPGPVEDMYYDLKDRHLLPLAAILLLAILIVPFALSHSPGGKPAAATSTGTTAIAGGATSGTSSDLVAKSAPTLRDYQRRLNHLTPKNPFHQQYTGGEPEGEGSGGTGSAESSTTVTSATPSEGTPAIETESTPEANTTPKTEPTTKTESTPKTHLTYYSYAIDVKVSTGNGEGGEGSTATTAGNVEVHHGLPELTMLPSREAPEVMYMGATKDGKKALMLVSSDVDSVFGDAKCVLGSETCQLLALEAGLPETFVYGGNGGRFTVELLKTRLVESKKPHRAPLGKPHKHAKKG